LEILEKIEGKRSELWIENAFLATFVFDSMNKHSESKLLWDEISKVYEKGLPKEKRFLFYKNRGIHFIRNFQYLKAISKFKEAMKVLTTNEVEYYYQRLYLAICLVFNEKIKEAKNYLNETEEILSNSTVNDKTLFRDIDMMNIQLNSNLKSSLQKFIFTFNIEFYLIRFLYKNRTIENDTEDLKYYLNDKYKTLPEFKKLVDGNYFYLFERSR
jgi:hypothetical protein